MCASCGTEVAGAGSQPTVAPLQPPLAGSSPFAPPAVAPVVFASEQAADVGGSPNGGARKKWLLPAALAVVLLGGGLLVWKLTNNDDGNANPGSTVPIETTLVSETTGAATTVVETTAVATTVVETTVVETTVVETTVEPTTVPSTDPPVTEPPPPAWLAPSVPKLPVFAGPGLAYAVSNPLAGGMNPDEASPYLLFAQGVFDKMAADDWAGVQPTFFFQLPDGQVVPYTFDLQSQWPSADRLSLLLVNAAPDTTGLTGYDLTVAVVANFSGSTSILCGHLYSDPNNYAEVIQRGAFALMADGLPPTMPESLLNDPTQRSSFMTGCV